jgi:PAS domain S-box-containing protein
MKQLDDSNFDKLFPFYVELDHQLMIVNVGLSIEKICGQINGKNVQETFDFVRPKMSINYSFESFLNHLDQVIIFECKNSKTRFRGQFIYEKCTETIIYINSPWLTDITELEQNKLLISDFALHDTVTDNLQLLRSKEITNYDLIKVNEELKQNQEKLLENNEFLKLAEEKYKILVESSTDIIFRVNSEGRYIYVNPTASKITGYTENEIIGKPFTFLLVENFKTKLKNFYNFQMDQKVESTVIEFPIRTKEGNQIWLEQSVKLIKTSDGKVEWIALARDVTEKKIAETSLLRSEEKYRSILENLELGLVEADVNNKIVKAYPKFCELVGYSESEILGQNGVDLLLDDEAKAVMDRQIARREEGKPSVYELQITKKSGEKVWVMISGAPFYDINNKFMGTIGIHLDISERKKMEEELKTAKELAENSLKSKEMFLANMSHEIRTPLNAIIGMSELLLQSDINTKQQNYLKAISTSSENLLALINDILNFSKIDAGKIELEKIPISIHQVISNSIELLKLKADEKNVLLTYNINENKDNGYLSDSLRLGEVLTNLLSNAIKFTTVGKVHLQCKIVEENDQFDRVFFEVQDTGIGIPADKLELIFEEFTQVNESTTRVFGGTGLGLSISKKMVSLFGGDLKVHSEIGNGSLFYFDILLQKTTLPKELIPSEIDASHLANYSILIVDDNDINLILAESILEKWNIKISKAINGADAVELVSSHDFDLILMDIQMPVLDGIGATWIIRNKLNKNIPIVALTANVEQTEQNRYLENGMDDYLCKPFKQHELYHAIKKNLRPNSQEREEVKSIVSIMDLKNLKETFENNEIIIQKMVQSFLETTPNLIIHFKTALTEQKTDEIKGLAHKVKPSLHYLAKEEVSKIAQEIENETNINQTFFDQVSVLISFLESLVDELRNTYSNN